MNRQKVDTMEWNPERPAEASPEAYLRALPECASAEEVLRLTLDQVRALAGGGPAVALGAGSPPLRVTAGAAGPALIAAAEAAWVGGGAPGNSADGAPPVWVLPLGAGPDPPGLIALQSATPPPPGAALAGVARAAGAQLALQLDREQMRRRLAELGLLYEVATAMSATLDLPELLATLVAHSQAALRSEACTLMLLDAATQELVFEIPTGDAETVLRQLRVPLSQGLCGWVAREGRPALVNDMRADPRFDSHVDQHSGFQTRNALCVPLLVRGQVSGVLEVLNKWGGEGYTDRDLDLLTTLAGQAALALDNAALYTSLQTEHARVLAAEEQVRKELARDLHDGPAQQMAALVMEVEVVRKFMAANPSRVPAELDSLEALARKANRQLRTMQFQLRPVMLETRGLRAAIEYYVAQLQETEHIRFTLDVTGCTGRLPANLEQAAFGIVQEALGNIRKHSGAQNALIRMWRQPGCWTISIRDDGRGFDVTTTLRTYETRGSLGLLNMRERAQAMGGQLDLASTPGQGTTITLQIPTEAYMPNEDSLNTALEIPPGGRGTL